MSEAYELVKNELLIKSGELFKIHGLYRYAGHVDAVYNNDCPVPTVAYRMIFRKDEKAPTLPSCSHDILWKVLRRE